MSESHSADDARLARAQGCLLGQLSGDALGSIVEFEGPATIRAKHPDGLRVMTGSPLWHTVPGQPTDDSEMALLLARLLIERGAYDPEAAREAYVFWLESDPFDRGNTITRALRGHPDAGSQANGALMRVSPLGIFGARFSREEAVAWAREDAALTHPHVVCRQANALYVAAIAEAVRTGCNRMDVYAHVLAHTEEMNVEDSLRNAITAAAETPPADYVRQQGWVLIALQNALWQLLHAPNFEEGVVDTIMRGGDTDTNAAICGALLGAVDGVEAIPLAWRQAVLTCRPEAGKPGVDQPRPACFWPVDALDLAAKLAGGTRQS